MIDAQSTTTTTVLTPARRAVGRYLVGLLPVMLIWAALAGWLAWTLLERAQWSVASDRAMIVEWLEEARLFRKSLAELVREKARLKAQGAFSADDRNEITVQLQGMAEPLRMFVNQLPGFPELYELSVTLPGEQVAWTSPVPLPTRAAASTVQTLDYEPEPGVRIRCKYHLHAFNRLERREEEGRQTALVAGVLLVTATLLAGLFVRRFWRREHDREIERFAALAAAEHRERELLAAKLAQEEAERKLENAEHEHRTQLYAGIGIMAGSYAHNIKNLLVRPNDLIQRGLADAQATAHQKELLGEVRATLSTVTERLQQILATVRRDPAQSHMQAMDLGQLAQETADVWRATAEEKWKAAIDARIEPGLAIVADHSHLQQALENLIFNARDATFELRNQLRDDARRTEGDLRKEKLLAAAAWNGSITLSVRRDGESAILAVTDTGIGMTADVKGRCLETHFSTKRDNALYEGYSAGMGLGLSFVARIAEQHAATITIDSTPGHGTTIALHFRLAPNPAVG
jgi:signal transduction histidine kinase